MMPGDGVHRTLRELGIERSGTKLEKEYELVDQGIRRQERRVLTFDGSKYDPKAVKRARDTWLARMAFEHNSTSVFAQLATQLMEANATLDAKVVMLRMAQDELRHTRTCGEVVQ